MTVTFETLIQHNKRMSHALVIGMVAFTAVVFGTFGAAFSGSPDQMLALFFGSAVIGSLVAITGSVGSFFFGGSIVAGITGARAADYSEDPVLFNVVEEMAIAAGVPVPKIYIIKDEAPNAFATGRDPKHAIIGITTGLRKKLTRDELQAVIAHEMGHIKNYDIRLMMMVGVFAGLIVLVSDFFIRHFLDRMWIGGGRRRTSSTSSNNASPLVMIVAIIVALVLAWVAPLIAKLMQLAVSREREYLADATGVQFCRNPLALASALKKIATDQDPLESANRATEHMFIVNPDPAKRNFISEPDSIWSTHPPTRRRIAKLDRMAGLFPTPEVSA